MTQVWFFWLKSWSILGNLWVNTLLELCLYHWGGWEMMYLAYWLWMQDIKFLDLEQVMYLVGGEAMHMQGKRSWAHGINCKRCSSNYNVTFICLSLLGPLLIKHLTWPPLVKICVRLFLFSGEHRYHGVGRRTLNSGKLSTTWWSWCSWLLSMCVRQLTPCFRVSYNYHRRRLKKLPERVGTFQWSEWDPLECHGERDYYRSSSVKKTRFIPCESWRYPHSPGFLSAKDYGGADKEDVGWTKDPLESGFMWMWVIQEENDTWPTGRCKVSFLLIWHVP